MDRLTVLHAFVRLVELQSFTTTAESLRVKQSTISKWIAELEKELDVRLVDRTTRSARVTEAGRRFYERASAIVDDYEDAVSELRRDSSVLKGRIRMTVPVVFGQRFVAPLAVRFLQEHEALELDLQFSERYVGLVEEGYDLAVRVGTPVDSSLRSHHLAEGVRRLVAAPIYLQKHGEPEHPEQLESHFCLVHNDLSSRTSWYFQKGAQSSRVTVGGRIAANNSEAVLFMARQGLGIALLASWLVDDSIRSGSLVQILDKYDVPSAPVRALTPPGRYVPTRVRLLINELREGLRRDL